MKLSEIRVLVVIGLIAAALIGFFWWLTSQAALRDQERQKQAAAVRSQETGLHVSGRAVDAETREPAGGVRLEAWDAGRLRPADRASGLFRTSALSDGGFLFRNVPFGRAAVDSCDDYYYAPAPAAVAAVMPGGGTGSGNAVLAAGAPQEFLLELRQGGMVEGLVQGPDGSPFPDALVLLESPAPAGTGTVPARRIPIPSLILKTRSDENGTFSFPRLPGGIDVGLTAFHPSTAPSQAKAAVVTAGERTPVTLILEPCARVRGTVRDALGKPVAAAWVRACGPGPKRKPIWNRVPFSQDEMLGAGLAVRASADGTFTLPCPLAPLYVAASAEGHAAGYSGVICASDESNEPAAVEIVLPDSGTITGVVRDAGAVVLAGVTVEATSVLGADLYFDDAKTDATGGFVLGPLPASVPASLTFRANGFSDATATCIPRGREPLAVTLGSGSALQGEVRSRTGEPVASFRVFLRPAGAVGGRSRVSEGAGGVFHVGDLPPGAWSLTVSAGGFHPVTLPAVAVESGPEPAMVAIVLDPTTEISGAVRLADGGGPLGGVMVVPLFRHPDGFFTRREDLAVTTSEDGAFALRGLEAGEWQLDIVRDSPALLWRHRDLRLPPAGSVTGIAVEVGKNAGSLELTVLGPSGDPAPGADVRMADATDAPLPGVALDRPFKTGADGRLLFQHLAAGHKRMIVTMPQPEPADIPPRQTALALTVKAGEVGALTVSFASYPVCRVTGKITRGGAPVANQALRVVPLEGEIPQLNRSRRIETDLDGRYTIEDLPAGRYMFLIEEPGSEPLDPRPLDIPGDQSEVRFDFELPAGAIRGQLTSKATSRPMARGSVFLYRLAEDLSGRSGVQVAAATAGEDGRYTFSAVEPGKYLIAALCGSEVGHLTNLVVGAGSDAVGADIQLAAGGSLEVAVVDEKDQALEGIMVWAEKIGADVITPPRRGLRLSDGQGQVRFRPLEVGDYRVVLGGAGRTCHVEPVLKIEAGQPQSLRILLPAGPQVILTIQTPDGTPVARCRLAVLAADGQWIGPPVSDQLITHGEFASSTGTYSLGGYTAGSFNLFAVAEGFKTATIPFTVPEQGGPVPLTVQLTPR